ncbi:YbjQ family protein [Eubacterium aggregans]|uniref:YbjQ family protein n=1 Tax=Eubacterium aggregans TaxID=81409 RepID=UPI003F2BB5FC
MGLVLGNTVQTVHLGKDFMAGLKTLVGGEAKGYNEMMTNARELATQRMITEAEALGADAIVGVRYSSDAIMENAAEILAYGTAVKFVE